MCPDTTCSYLWNAFSGWKNRLTLVEFITGSLRGFNYPRQEVTHHIRNISYCILHRGINSSIYHRLTIYFWWERRSKYQFLTKGSTFYQFIVMWNSFLFFPNCLLTFDQVEHNFGGNWFRGIFSTILLLYIININR